MNRRHPVGVLLVCLSGLGSLGAVAAIAGSGCSDNPVGRLCDLGASTPTVDSIVVQWPATRGAQDTRVSVLTHVAANQRVVIRQAESHPAPVAPLKPAALLTDVSDAVAIPFVHHENEFVDFDREPLMPKLLSTEGPFMAVADVNGDGLDDVFIGGRECRAVNAGGLVAGVVTDANTADRAAAAKAAFLDALGIPVHVCGDAGSPPP